MSDNKFTIDELMNEYSDSGEKFDLNSILGDSDNIPDISEEPYDPEMEKRRMELIRKETISGDYEHKYLAEDYSDVIAEENRRKEEKMKKIAEFSRAMEEKQKEEQGELEKSDEAKEEEPAAAENNSDEFIKQEEKVLPIIPDTDNISLSQRFKNEINEENEENSKKAENENKDENITDSPANDDSEPENEEEKEPILSKKEKKEKLKREKRIKKDKKKHRISEEDEDEFQRKYEILKKNGLGVMSKSERNEKALEAFDEMTDEMEKEEKSSPGRTFSEKLEEDNSEDEDFFSEKNRKRTPKVVTDKSGLVYYSQDQKTEDEEKKPDYPLESYSDNSIDKIISEYEKSKTFTQATFKVGDKTNTISDIFDKILKPSEGADSSEMLENMKRAKAERLSASNHTQPVGKPDPSEIVLDNIEDKIIKDTIPMDKIKKDEISESEKEALKSLEERRSKKLQDFVFTGDEDESDEEKENDEEKEIDDFENMDDADSIADDIARSKSSMIVRLIILIICFIISFYITVSSELSAPVFEFVSMTDEPATYLFVNTIIGMIAAFSAYNAVATGLYRLVTFKANSDSLAAMVSVITILLSMVGLLDTDLVRSGFIHEYVPIGIAALIFNTIGKILLLDRTQRNFRYISGGVDHYAIFTVKNEEKAENFTKGSLTDFPVLATMRKTDMISDFMKNSYSPDLSDRFCKTFTPIILIASLVAGIIGAAASYTDYGSRSFYIGFSSFVSCICLCSCFAMMLIVNLPMQKASKKYSSLGGAVIGFDAIDEFSDTNSVMTDAADLFPAGSVTLVNIKIFSDTRIDEAIIEAASLACRSESITKSMFYEIIGGKTAMLNPVESYIYEDSMGLCGWIDNKRVLLGNKKLMENHSIDGLPSQEKEREYTSGGKYVPVYLSISGELSAVFVINLTPVPEIANTVRELYRKGIKIVLRSVDSAVTVERMAKMFRISPDALKILPFREHSEYENVTSYTSKQSATLACSGRFAAFSNLILSTKRIRATSSAGIAVEAVSILLGILITAFLVLFKSYTELSVAMIFFYNIIFTIIYLIINMIRKV